MLSIFKKKKIIVTHNGVFHADDLFACATLSLWFKKHNQPFKIVRTRNPEKIKTADIVFDVGGIYDPKLNRFDHHQPGGAGNRENGIPYAAFGLVWKHFGLELCDGNTEVHNMLDTKIAAPLDAIDNGVDVVIPKFDGVMPYGGEQPFLIFSPTWKEDESRTDEIFLELSKRVAEVIAREIKVAKTDNEGRRVLIEAYEKAIDKRMIEISIAIPRYLFQKVLSIFPEPLYLVYPSGTTTSWKVEAIPKTPTTLESRKKFPETWCALFDNQKNLTEVTGVADTLFCHRGGFLVTVKSKESALKLAKIALKA